MTMEKNLLKLTAQFSLQLNYDRELLKHHQIYYKFFNSICLLHHDSKLTWCTPMESNIEVISVVQPP